MAQFLRPVSDVSAGLWTTAPIWDKLDEAVASDADFVTSNNNTSPDAFEVALSPPSGTPAAGTVTLRVRRSKSATGGHALQERIELYQGSTLINVVAQATPDSTAWAVVTLNIGNRGAITDWSDLRVRVSREGATGGSGGTRRSLRVSHIELETPDAAAPEVHNATLPAMTGSGAATVAASKRAGATATFTGGGTVVVAHSAVEQEIHSGSVVVSGSGVVSLAARKTVSAPVTFTGGGALTVVASHTETSEETRSGSVSLTGSGALSLTQSAAKNYAVQGSGSGALALDVSTVRSATSAGSGSGTFLVEVSPVKAAGVSLTGGGSAALSSSSHRRTTIAGTGSGAVTTESSTERHASVSGTGGGSVRLATGGLQEEERSASVALTGGGTVQTVQSTARSASLGATGSGSVNVAPTTARSGSITATAGGSLTVEVSAVEGAPVVAMDSRGVIDTSLAPHQIADWFYERRGLTTDVALLTTAAAEHYHHGHVQHARVLADAAELLAARWNFVPEGLINDRIQDSHAPAFRVQRRR